MALTAPDYAIILGGFLECTFYGAYTILFILYLVLRRRNNHRLDRPLSLAHILLFGLCTLSFFFDVAWTYLIAATEDDVTTLKLNLGSMVLFGIIDCLAQMILLYRCWIIWDTRWAVVAVPGFLALVSLVGQFAVFGLVDAPVDTWYILLPTGTATNATSLVVNALTTSLIVTKILLTTREVRPVLGSKSQRSFRIVTALLIESGLLMFAFQLVYVIIFYRIPFDIISNSITQIYGITPTLLNIRVAMGTAYDKTTEKTRTLRFAHSEGAAAQATSPSMSVAGVQSRDINTELDGVPNKERASESVV